MNKLDKKRQAQVVAALVEGASVNSTVRMTGVSKPTILKLLSDLGTACAKYQDEKLRNLPSKRVQADEIWSFCFAKDKNLSDELKGKFGFGSVWTWTAICADTKLMISWLVGERSVPYAEKFISDVASRLSHRVQLTTDGHRAYLQAVEKAFGAGIDYAMLEKIYAVPPQEGVTARYSPAQCCGTKTHRIAGNPDDAHISTSYAERMNLQIRMSMRRFTRLTNAHSKKVENHRHALALYFMYYNFARIHSTLRVTPAMQAGVSDHVWSIEEIVSLLK
ncbi:MAG: IS1 family transposase [Nitrospira sp.]|nr:IS1 family transposase [Nitrospira sp.]